MPVTPGMQLGRYLGIRCSRLVRSELLGDRFMSESRRGKHQSVSDK